jgi:hypothetical protein
MRLWNSKVAEFMLEHKISFQFQNQAALLCAHLAHCCSAFAIGGK